ncbi:MAG: hypothetical protein ABI907_05800 [Ramlibacter sp.]
MLLQKTEKARVELRPGQRTLGLRERSLLLLADGSKSLMDFQQLFDGQGGKLVLTLVRDGYLEASVGRATQPRPPMAAVPINVPAATPPAMPVPAPVASGDAFEGKRSLATTRMFLFDICERMFARRDPLRAEQFREALRGAKDRESMLSAAREMIGEIERAAGHERADSISERIAMLLPPETA